MLHLVLVVTSYEELQNIPDYADAVELRLDYLPSIELHKITAILQTHKLPIIFTLRSSKDGGKFNGTEQERLETILRLAKLKPTYFDLESNIANAFITNFAQQFPSIKIIRSYHNFTTSDVCLKNILNHLLHPQCFAYKIITYAQRGIDNLKVLDFLRTHNKQYNLIMHCMGPLGGASRIIGALLGNYFCYASSKLDPHYGMYDLATLYNLYGIKKRLTRNAKIYALIGHDIAHSQGEHFHNQIFAQKNTDAVYVKLDINSQDLNYFFQKIVNFNFVAFSVTMPLKTKITNFITSYKYNAAQIGAINTLQVKGDAIIGWNTDGLAAVQLLQNHLSLAHSEVLILGAGGSARAIIHYLKESNCKNIVIINRKFKEGMAGTFFDFNTFTVQNNKKYNIVINTLPPHAILRKAFIKALHQSLNEDALILDINYQAQSKIRFLHYRFIDGKQFFMQQAKLQQQSWHVN